MQKFDKKRPGCVDPSWTKKAKQSLWAHYANSREPALEEVLDDPIVMALAASDHVSRSDIDVLVKIIRDFRAAK